MKFDIVTAKCISEGGVSQNSHIRFSSKVRESKMFNTLCMFFQFFYMCAIVMNTPREDCDSSLLGGSLMSYTPQGFQICFIITEQNTKRKKGNAQEG